MDEIAKVKALTFDLFGTVLNLGDSLTPFIADFLKGVGTDFDAGQFWDQWRYRQRIEQYQDTIMMLGHSGYLETSRRALVYTLRRNGLEVSAEEVAHMMQAWQELNPYPEVVDALRRLATQYRLVALSNGDPEFLVHLAQNRVKWDFDNIISATTIGAFKPHPGVYRRAASILGLEVGQCMMISSNSFDVVGARACGFKAAYINRTGMPYEDTPFLPNLTVKDFSELADQLA